MGKLEGKVALVTGASRGIGKAVASLFAAEGARVACVARTLQEGEHRLFEGSLETTVREIGEAGARAIAVAGDVSQWEDCERIVQEVRAAFGPIDVLVNNAGITRDGLILRMKDEDWDQVLTVNLAGAFRCARAALRPMLKQKQGGRIINIGS
ncbi:MAG TPA: beta-ketoacyl-ACP reductase, partial [Deltaproteobacteria bacterium]|nr:beta-ketoacyl-ACP reductase [Deltaproteobacteria bacterium]